MLYEKKRLTADQAKDAGMALSLLCFLIGASLHLRWLEWSAMAVLAVDMVWPPIFRPFATLWFALAEAIGAVTSKILLSILYFLVVTPVGLVRRAMGRDPMLVKRWKRDRVSTFLVCERRYTPGDLDRPY